MKQECDEEYYFLLSMELDPPLTPMLANIDEVSTWCTAKRREKGFLGHYQLCWLRVVKGGGG
jgi:hypothetical protein